MVLQGWMDAKEYALALKNAKCIQPKLARTAEYQGQTKVDLTCTFSEFELWECVRALTKTTEYTSTTISSECFSTDSVKRKKCDALCLFADLAFAGFLITSGERPIAVLGNSLRSTRDVEVGPKSNALGDNDKNDDEPVIKPKKPRNRNQDNPYKTRGKRDNTTTNVIDKDMTTPPIRLQDVQVR